MWPRPISVSQCRHTGLSQSNSRCVSQLAGFHQRRRPGIAALRVRDPHAVVRPAKQDLLPGSPGAPAAPLLAAVSALAPCASATVRTSTLTPEPAAMHRLDHALHRAVIAERLSQCLDARVQGSRSDEPVAPHVLDQLLRRHETIVMLDQVAEHRVHLRLQVLRLAATTKLVAFRVEGELSELVNHRSRSLRRSGAGSGHGSRSPRHLQEFSIGSSSLVQPGPR